MQPQSHAASRVFHQRERKRAVEGLKNNFVILEDKKYAWNDLHRLTQDNDDEVRVAANHSSGRVSIYKVSQEKDDESVRKELETALRFFEINEVS